MSRSDTLVDLLVQGQQYLREGLAMPETGTATGSSVTLMDIAGVAERLGVTVRHVRRLVAERRIPFVKWGHLIRFDPADIDPWLDGMRRPVSGQ